MAYILIVHIPNVTLSYLYFIVLFPLIKLNKNQLILKIKRLLMII